MAKIIIGKKYEAEFSSICRLVQGGCVPPEIVRRADGREIVTDGYVFVYDGGESGAAQGEAAAQGMTGEGASWFAPLRGKAHSDGTAVWLNLIERVAESYHRRYSFIEYKQGARRVSEAERQAGLRALQTVTARLFDGLSAAEVREGSPDEGTEDLYGVSLRVELSGGTGEAVPALAKLYFRKRDKKLVPLFAWEADKVDAYLGEIIPEKESGARDNSDSSDTIDAVLNAMQALLYGKKGAADFAQCLYLGSEEDSRTVGALVEKGAHAGVQLECRAVKVLGIAHVRWINDSYGVYAGGKQLLRATMGLNGSLCLYCANCGTGALIENNRIDCSFTDAEGQRYARSVVLDLSREDLGITEEDAEDIRRYSAFANHLKTISCGENPRRGGCSRCVCRVQTENLGTEEEPVYKCKDCPYPEVVFVNEKGERKYTPRLAFARDKMTMIERTDAQVCDCCGRSFSKESMHGRLCAFCHGAAAGGGQDAAKKTYRRYARMFSPFTRLRYAGKKKLCYEEEDVLLFVMGEDKYIFDKLAIGEYGYIGKPRKAEE